MNVLLINPNTNAATTAMMLAVARANAPAGWDWQSLTAGQGSALIDGPEALALATGEVVAMGGHIAAMAVDAVIVAAFGDPGMQALRDALSVPVFGIGESAMKAADALGLPFSVLTITPKLRESTLRQLQRYGCDTHFNSLVITTDDAATTTSSPARLVEKIKTSIRQAIDADGSQVLVIGGGPVAAAAQEIGDLPGVVVIQPLLAAIADVAQVGQLQDLCRQASPLSPS